MISLQAMEGVDGFCSASLMVDRDSGRAVSSVTFDSLEAQPEAGSLGDVCEFELALAHLRVPELA
jgi:hypothetical protein